MTTPNTSASRGAAVGPADADASSNRYWRIVVKPRAPEHDGRGRDALTDVRAVLGPRVRGIRTCRYYFLAGRLDQEAVETIARRLLTDTVTERSCCAPGLAPRDYVAPAIEVHLLPGVMDPPALTVRQAANRLLRASGGNDATVDEVRTARGFEFDGDLVKTDLELLASRVLANSCIERCYLFSADRRDAPPDSFPAPPVREFRLRTVPLFGMDDDALARLSREGHLFLALDEMRAIRDHFARLNRDPTDLELETLAQTWSEHCVHKTLKSAVRYRGRGFGDDAAKEVEIQFENLLKETIVAATRKLDRSWCLSVFVDNAGVIEFDEEYGIAFKVETHNHPSAIEPYGGASTGVGGCIRDIMGCGLGAKPIASTDVFCLAHPDFDPARIPKDVLHPRRTLKGVVGGVRDYGNRMGIPTVNGAIYFDDRYLANPLVYCGCVGLLPRNRLLKGANPGDLIVVAGGRTGRDGIHGATFSSAELTDSHADEFAHAVQIGNAIEQKKLLDALLRARDHERGCLYSAVTDCGAGGLSSAVGEMGERIGADVNLERVPLKYSGLRYDEIWISEAQERMVFAVPPDRWTDFQRVFIEEEVEAADIGRFTDDNALTVRFGDTIVGRLDMHFLHHGRPDAARAAVWNGPSAAGRSPWLRQADPWNPTAPGFAAAESHGAGDAIGRGPTGEALSANDRILCALRRPNVASKEWVVRQYDHEVQGRSVVKPLTGPNAGPSDAAVLRPRYDSHKGIALACGLCPELFDFDPYWMAVAAVDEALRNVVCVGANLDRVAILDNFCWPRCDAPEAMGSLVRACRGAHDAALAFGLPFISGKDSLNNEFAMTDDEARRTGLPNRLAIPGTLLISALGLVDDVRRCVTMDLKHAGHALVLASDDRALPSLEASMGVHRRVSDLIRSGKVTAAHDVSDGGWALAVSEMCIGSGRGATLAPGDHLAGEAPYANRMAAYVLEMREADAAGCGFPIIGTVTDDALLRCAAIGLEVPVAALAEAWREPIARAGGNAHG